MSAGDLVDVDLDIAHEGGGAFLLLQVAFSVQVDAEDLVLPEHAKRRSQFIPFKTYLNSKNSPQKTLSVRGLEVVLP